MKGPGVVLRQPPVTDLFVNIDDALLPAYISWDEYILANFTALCCRSSQGRRWYQSESRHSMCNHQHYPKTLERKLIFEIIQISIC